jgi:hypothetical protein
MVEIVRDEPCLTLTAESGQPGDVHNPIVPVFLLKGQNVPAMHSGSTAIMYYVGVTFPRVWLIWGANKNPV